MSDNLPQIIRRILEWLSRIFAWLRERLRYEDHPVRYFLPGKIMLHFEHPEGLTQAQLAADIGSFLEGVDDQRAWKQQVVPPKPEDILIFPLRNNEGLLLSIVPLRLRDDKITHDDMIPFLRDIRAGLPNDGLRISDNNVTLNSVAPDWLVGAVHHAGHPPSPGSWPLQADTPQEVDWSYQLKDKQTVSRLPFEKKGAKVNVAILDTAPTAAYLDESFEKWPSHRLLERLWGTNRKLHLHTGIYTGIELADNSVVGHRYLMRDHGSFVAGIVNTISPEATLHLFQVFTPYGSASTDSIVRGIDQIVKTFRNEEDKENWEPLIVNCSFGLNLESHLPNDIQEMITFFQEVFNRLASQEEVLIVAAAGNFIERSPQGRPYANYPAAFPEVIGVGALSKGFQQQVASYSNLAYRPPDAGYMALGGEPGPGNGVLGVYTTEIPYYSEGCLGLLLRILTLGFLGWSSPGHLPPNPRGLTIDRIRYKVNYTGWAWWAGTSFAAPVISGILANWCSQPPGDRAPGDPLHQPINLENARTALGARSQSATTDVGEQVIFVKQGP